MNNYTQEQLSKLDDLVAIKIMSCDTDSTWTPTVRIDQAFRCLEEMHTRLYWRWRLELISANGATECVMEPLDRHLAVLYRIQASSASLAIVLCCLKAAGVNLNFTEDGAE